jgi:hypothetical protein
LAAPHVAGGLALLLSAYPNLDAGVQEHALINTALDLGASGPDDVFGYGRLDLFAAINWAAAAPTSTPPLPTPTIEPSSTPTPTETPNVNLALNQPVMVSSSQDSAHSGDMAVDGNLFTQWKTARVMGKNRLSSEWIEVDLGSVKDVSQVILDWDAYFATTYTIDVSGDGNSWSSVVAIPNGDGGNDTLSINTVQARYIRLTSTAWSSNSYHIWLKEFTVYAVGTASNPSPTPSATTIVSTATPLPTATVTPTQLSNDSVHVGDLDASSLSNKNHWSTVVTILVHDSNESPVQGVTISGSWGDGAYGAGSCGTGPDGTCTITYSNLKNNVGSVSFSISDLSFGFPYQAAANHDPDGDSDGSSIIISRP